MNLKNTITLIVLAPIILTGILSGCEETTINPFEERTDVFSIYGVLDLSNATNVVRIKKVTAPLLEDSTNVGGFDVVFSDLQSDVSIELEPEVINFNGNYTLNYPIDYPIQPYGQYKIMMVDVDGTQATALARTPGIAVPSVDTLGIDNFGPLSGGNTECNTEHNFVFANVNEDEDIVMFSGIRFEGRTLWARTGTVDKLKRVANTDTLTARLSVRQLLFDHFPLNNQDYVNVNPRFWPSTVNCRQLDSNEILIRYFHFSEDWDVFGGDEINSIDLFESGVIENGNGFFGGMNTGYFKYRFYDPIVFPTD